MQRRHQAVISRSSRGENRQQWRVPRIEVRQFTIGSLIFIFIFISTPFEMTHMPFAFTCPFLLCLNFLLVLWSAGWLWVLWIVVERWNEIKKQKTSDWFFWLFYLKIFFYYYIIILPLFGFKRGYGMKDRSDFILTEIKRCYNSNDRWNFILFFD